MKGYLRQRSKTKDTWLLTVDLGRDPANGKRRQLFETVQGKRKAQTRLAELVASAKAGFTLRPERVTLGQYLNQWLTTYAATNVRPRTAEGYAGKLSPNPPMRSGLGVRTRGEGRGTRRSALDSDKWGRWRPLVVVGGADGGPGQRRCGGVGGTVCRGRQSRTGPVRLCGAVG